MEAEKSTHCYICHVRFYSSNISFSYFFRAILNVVTDDAQWTYEVIGNYPDLNIRGNNMIKSKINSGR